MVQDHFGDSKIKNRVGKWKKKNPKPPNFSAESPGYPQRAPPPLSENRKSGGVGAGLFFNREKATPELCHFATAADIMVKKLPACYGIKKGRGAPVVVHSWAEVVAKVSQKSRDRFPGGPSPTESLLLPGLRGAVGGAAAAEIFEFLWRRLESRLCSLPWLLLFRARVTRFVPPFA